MQQEVKVLYGNMAFSLELHIIVIKGNERIFGIHAVWSYIVLRYTVSCKFHFNIKQSFRFVEYDQEYDKPKFTIELYDIILSYYRIDVHCSLFSLHSVKKVFSYAISICWETAYGNKSCQ